MQVTIDGIGYNCEIIPSFDSYAATRDGLIITLRRKGHAGVTGLMHPSANEKGYMAVTLRKNGKLYRKKVHRLVWETYNGPIQPGLEINHIDEDKSNNRLDNLCLVTHAENLNYGTHNARAAETKRRTALRKGASRNAVSVSLKIGGKCIAFPSVMEAVEATAVSKTQFYKGLKLGYIKKYGHVIATVLGCGNGAVPTVESVTNELPQ